MKQSSMRPSAAASALLQQPLSCSRDAQQTRVCTDGTGRKGLAVLDFQALARHPIPLLQVLTLTAAAPS